MKGILADINIQGHVAILQRVWVSDAWREVFDSLGVLIHTFGDVGLNADASDKVIWHLCQKEEFILITANRNDEGSDSLRIHDPHSQFTTLPARTHPRERSSSAEKQVIR